MNLKLIREVHDTVERTYKQIWISFEIYTSVGLAQARPNKALFAHMQAKSLWRSTSTTDHPSW